MINKEPIYQQLNRMLRNLIAGDEYNVGDQFLTERSICEKFEVSRATANKALSSLVSEGFLRFKKGVGTFIKAKPAIGGSLNSMTSFTQNTLSAGMVPKSVVLRFESTKGSEVDGEILQRLEIEPAEPLYLLERLRFAADVPMILESRFIVSKYCPDLFELSLKGSLYALFCEHYGLNITGSDETIQAVLIQPHEAELLKVDQGKAGFLVTAVGYIDDNIPLWYERTLHRPDGFEYRCQVMPQSNFQRLQGRIIMQKK